MDPNATLEQLREESRNNPDQDWTDLFLALDMWLTSGGFLPSDWQPAPTTERSHKL